MQRRDAFIQNGQWYKGNTHLHTTNSDGTQTPEEAVAAYRSAGYDFLVITDHWHYSNDPKLQSENFLLFAGIEIDDIFPLSNGKRSTKGICHHVTAMADPACTPYATGDTLSDLRAMQDMAKMVDVLNQSHHLCIYAHPTWSHVHMSEYQRIQGCIGVEVFNNVCDLEFGSGYSQNYFDAKLWQRQPCLCFASDDAHSAQHNFGGFIVVKAKNFTHAEILQSIRQGSFYASNGPTILDFFVEGDQATIQCQDCSEVFFFHDFYPGGSRVLPQLKEGILHATYKVPANASYLYAVCRDGKRQAWTQPIWLTEHIEKV